MARSSPLRVIRVPVPVRQRLDVRNHLARALATAARRAAKRNLQEVTIGQLAEAAEVNVETVRYYHRRGLLPVSPSPNGGIRRYPADVLRGLHFIKRSRSLGFSLDKVEALLSLHDGQTCRAARAQSPITGSPTLR